MAKVIIGIHGLGNKPARNLLEFWWWSAISEGLKNHTKNKYKKPLFKLVYWTDILYDHPKDANCTDPDNPYYISEPYLPSSIQIQKKDNSLRKKIMDSLLEEVNKIFLNADYSLNFSGLNDLIIENYFKDLDAYYSDQMDNKQPSVKNILRERLKSVLMEHKNDEILLIAHSMGSIVAFDVLALFDKEVLIDTFITIGSPLGLPVVKSKIANELKLKNSKQGQLSIPASIKNYWYNLSDLEDKIAFNYKLEDDFSENTLGIKVIDFEVNNTYISNGQHNPHKSYGYLQTPEIAQIIYDFITKVPPPYYFRIWHSVKKIFGKPETPGVRPIN